MIAERTKKLKELLSEIQETINEYGDRNEFRAIFEDKMPNCNEDVDVTDVILKILNSDSREND